MDSAFVPSLGIDTPMEAANLIIATITNVGCIYLVIVMLWWWWRLRTIRRNQLRPLLLGIAFAKAAIWFWSFTGLLQIVLFNMTLPSVTLPARLLLMTAILIQTYVTAHYYPSRSLHSLFRED